MTLFKKVKRLFNFGTENELYKEMKELTLNQDM